MFLKEVVFCKDAFVWLKKNSNIVKYYYNLESSKSSDIVKYYYNFKWQFSY